MKLHYAIALLLGDRSRRCRPRRVPPALMVQEDGRSTPLGLAKLQTEVRILGSVAETTTTMTFANPSARAMEGDLYFPLPEGATISGYALDINGAMVDGVAVEKHEARRVFEEVVRRGIDPGAGAVDQGQQLPDAGLSHPGPRQPHRAGELRHGVDRRQGGPGLPPAAEVQGQDPRVLAPRGGGQAGGAAQGGQGRTGQFRLREVARELRRRNQAAGLVARRGPGHRPAEDGRAAGGRREGRRRAGVFRHPGLSGRAAEAWSTRSRAQARRDLLGRLRARGPGDHAREIAAAASVFPSSWLQPQ